MCSYDVNIQALPHPQKNTLIQMLGPQGFIQSNRLIYSDRSRLDDCKIVVEGSLIHFMSHD